ncbi:MAG TPA: PqqD family peptide modification chaperone [Nitrospiria bacterium]
MEGSTITKKEIVQQDLGNELMLYDAQKDEVHILNGTAKIVWEGLVVGETEEQLEMRLRERFLIGKDRDLFLDIRNIIGEFKEKGLVKQ